MDDSWVMHDAEAATIRAFVLPGLRDRVTGLTSKPDRAGRLQTLLAHQRILNERFMTQVPPGHAFAASIADSLRAKGAPATCRVMGGPLDAQELALEEALGTVVGWNDGCLVICVPGRLAYFEGEEPNDRHIHQR
jgi:hypothetical protein